MPLLTPLAGTTYRAPPLPYVEAILSRGSVGIPITTLAKGQHANTIASKYGGFTFAPACARAYWTTSSKGKGTKKKSTSAERATTERKMWVEIVADGWISKLEGHVTQCEVCVCVCGWVSFFTLAPAPWSPPRTRLRWRPGMHRKASSAAGSAAVMPGQHSAVVVSALSLPNL